MAGAMGQFISASTGRSVMLMWGFMTAEINPRGRWPMQSFGRGERRLHEAFDPTWRDGGITRKKAYHNLSRGLGIPWKDAHIGQFDLETCKKTVALFSDEPDPKPKTDWKKPKIFS